MWSKANIVHCYCNNLIIGKTLIEHVHDSYNHRLNEAQGWQFDRSEHQDIQRIAILAVRLSNEPIICRIVNRWEKGPAWSGQYPYPTKISLAALWYLNDCVHYLGSLWPVMNLMPWVIHFIKFSAKVPWLWLMKHYTKKWIAYMIHTIWRISWIYEVHYVNEPTGCDKVFWQCERAWRKKMHQSESGCGSD